MNARSVRKVIPAGMWYGLGIMCGNGYEFANRIVWRSDSEALYEDWERIGGDFRKVMGEVDSELDSERNQQGESDLGEHV